MKAEKMPSLSFTPTQEEGEAVTQFSAPDGTVHRVERMKVWKRVGGWQYAFRCSCGWKGENPYVRLSNYEANMHAYRVAKNVVERSVAQ